MADEPELPRLPTVTWNPETQSFNNTRKRARQPGHAQPPPNFSNSSDPAVFSSDDDPSVDNYVHGKHRKKRYVGSWYQQHLASSDSAFGEEVRSSPKKVQRTFQRQFDSGVWMGSDGFTEDDEDTMIDAGFSAEPRLPQLSHVPVKTAISQTEQFALQRIQEAIDTGNENIDLTGMGLEELSNETISRLSEFACIPIVAEDVPFEQSDPSLRLYLAQNPLIRAPGAIFNLEFLTVLSLRNTRITELPPSIANLRNLTDLNVALNRLRYLPGELLDLLQSRGKLQNLIAHPNPFHQPESTPSTEIILPKLVWDDWRPTARVHCELKWPGGRVFRAWQDSEEDDAAVAPPPPPQDDHLFRWRITAVSRSPVQYSDSRGVVLSKFQLPALPAATPGGASPPPADQNPTHVTVATEDIESTPTQQFKDARAPSSSSSSLAQSRVPSLFELALRACARSGQPPRDLPSYLPPDAPARFPAVLERLAAQAEDNGGATAAGVQCATCGRRGVMAPTTAWIEWWVVARNHLRPYRPYDFVEDRVGTDPPEAFIPFLRRGCSWACGPAPVRPGQLRPGSVRWSVVDPNA